MAENQNSIDFYHKVCHNRINNIPSLKEFATKVAECDNFEIKNISKHLNIIANKHFLLDLLNYELDNLNKSNDYFPVQSSFTQLNILHSDHFFLHINLFKEVDFTKKTVMSPSPYDICDVLLSEKPWAYKLLRCDNPYPLDVLKDDILIDKGEKSMIPFESIFLEKNKDIFVPISKDGTYFVLSLVSRDYSSFMTEYDRETKKAMRLVAGTHTVSRLQFACQLLGEFGSETSIKYIEPYLSDSNYIIRWEAVKALMLISYDVGLKALEKVKNDSHPEIRELSNKYLMQFKI
jgi:hypothetical protein